MPKKKKKQKPKPQEVSDLTVPFPGVVKFLLGNKKRMSLTTICGAIIAASVAFPIAVDWSKKVRSGAESILTVDVQNDLVKVKKKQEQIVTAHGLMTQSIGHIRESQSNLQVQQHQMWSDIRGMRGMAPPPTPEPIPTFVPTPEVLTADASDGSEVIDAP